MRRSFSRTAPVLRAPPSPRLRALRDAPERASAPAVQHALAAFAGLIRALDQGGAEAASARRALAESLLPLTLPDIPALSAALDPTSLHAALSRASLADQARLLAIGPAETILLPRTHSPRGAEPPRAGVLLAVIALRALPALPEAIDLLALGWAPAATLLAAELELLEAPPDSPEAAARLAQALAALPQDLRAGAACPTPVTRVALAREPWRQDLAAIAPPAPPPAATREGTPTRFRHAIRMTLDAALPAGAARRLSLRTTPALPPADWVVLADGQPVFAQASAAEGVIDITFASAVALPAGTLITAVPPAGEYFRHYTVIEGEVWPLRPTPLALPPLVLTALAEPCFEGFHKPEHLPGAIGRWMSQHGRIRLPSCPTPLRATLRGRHRQALIGEGGLLAALGDLPLDLLLEPLGLPHDEGEWLLHLHLPPTTPPGQDWLRLSLPDLPPRGASEARDIGLIFLAIELALLPNPTSHRFGAAL